MSDGVAWAADFGKLQDYQSKGSETNFFSGSEQKRSETNSF